MDNPETPLDEFLKQYGLGVLERNALESKIFVHVLTHQEKFGILKIEQEDRMDFLCWFYFRLHRAIDAYENTGASFDAYVHSLIQWSIREYKRIEKDHRVREEAYWKARQREFVQEDELIYDTSPQEPDQSLPLVKNKRQMLILALKCCPYISEDLEKRIAETLHMDRVELSRCLEMVRQKRNRRIEANLALQERIKTQYYRCIIFQARMKAALKDSVHRAKMERSWINAQRRLENMRKRLLLIRQEPSNQEIAEVLKITKGAVDANLHILRWKWTVNREEKDHGSQNLYTPGGSGMMGHAKLSTRLPRG